MLNNIFFPLSLFRSFFQRFRYFTKGLGLFIPPHFNALLVRKKHGKLQFISLKNYENRNESTLNLILAADKIRKFDNFSWKVINTDDCYQGESYLNIPMLSYSVTPFDYERGVPDFIFDHWKQTGIDSYEVIQKILFSRARLLPATNKMGWRGAETHSARRNFIDLFDQLPDFDIEMITWDRSNPNQLNANNFMSLQDQQASWRFMIDVEGRGYSARLKLLLASGRVVFIQDRVHHEFFFKDLIPWVHYVPVKSDFSDLLTHLDRLLSNPELEKKIIDAALIFAMKNLTRDAAVSRFIEVFG